jgi:hypothetical protein
MVMGITSALYKAARLSADMRAVSKGPKAMGRRVVRKAVYRKTNGLVASALFRLFK